MIDFKFEKLKTVSIREQCYPCHRKNKNKTYFFHKEKWGLCIRKQQFKAMEYELKL
jgi:hypothetical protein